MADIQHREISNADLHEPKGANVASSRQFYKSDGAGSGVWEYVRTGWGSYVDVSSGTQTFATTASIVEIDGAAGNTDYLPHEIRASGDLWDTTNDLMTPIREGDAYTVRIELPITAKSGSPTHVTLQYDIGGSGTPTNIIAEDHIIIDTPPFEIVKTTSFFTLATFISNGMQIFLSVDTGSIDVELPTILITKVHDGLD